MLYVNISTNRSVLVVYSPDWGDWFVLYVNISTNRLVLAVYSPDWGIGLCGM